MKGWNDGMTVAILLHLYHTDMWEEMKGYIDKVTCDKTLYVSLNDAKMEKTIKEAYPDAKTLVCENKGMDIGATLRLIDIWKNDKDDVLLKLHTKSATCWRQELCKPIFDNFDRILQSFENDTNLGMVGSEKWLIRIQDVNYNHCVKYFDKFNIPERHRTIEFIGGTIFCVRSSIYRDFFADKSGEELANELEEGKPPEPSNTHAFERILGRPIVGDYLINSYKYVPPPKVPPVYIPDQKPLPSLHSQVRTPPSYPGAVQVYTHGCIRQRPTR